MERLQRVGSKPTLPTHDRPVASRAEPPHRETPVWDIPVRVFHWATVVLVAAAFLSPDAKAVHEPLGYVILGLLVARLAWGVVGTRHARFADFVASPSTVLQYLRRLRSGRARRYLGHNPAGGVMVLALLGTLLVVTISGWLSETDRFFGVEWVSSVHRVSSDVLLGLMGLHLAGVLISSLIHRENLIAAMITGRKTVSVDHAAGCDNERMRSGSEVHRR